MKTLLTGGTGYIGSAVLTSLVANGHDVTALVRSAEAATRVASAGATALVGDATNVAWLTSHLQQVDGAIHTAAPSEGAAEFDRAIVEAVIAAFADSGRPFVHTGGIWSYGNSSSISEDSPRNPPRLTAWRGAAETMLLQSDVAATVIEPGIVYGCDAGILTMLASGPRSEGGALTLIGDGTQHWATVHVDDLAELYRLVLDGGSGLGYLIAASGANPTVADLGLAIAGEFGVVPSTREETRAQLGDEFADALLLDQRADGAKARSLGWVPAHSAAHPPC